MEAQLLSKWQYLRFGVMVHITIEDNEWIIRKVISNRQTNELRLPVTTGDLDDLNRVRERTLKWIDSNYTTF